MIHNKKSEVTTELSSDHNEEFYYFIDGMFYQQKGWKTEKEAKEAGQKKLAEILNYHKKK